MSSELLKSVFDLPDVSFIDDDTMNAIMQRLVKNYETRYKEITGTQISLGAADPMRILLYTIALDLYQIEQYVDRAGKQDLLKYSYGEFLDNLAANRSVTRNQPEAARATIRFSFSEAKDYVQTIPEGIRVTNGNGVYFKTIEYAEAPAGALYVDVPVICTEEGTKGNGFLPGQIDTLVDPLPYVESIANITTTDGGAELESDESLAERTYIAPSGYSVAGPGDAYVYWAKTFSANIGCVKATSPAPGEVTLYFLMADGTLPGEEVLEGLEEYLANNDIRPMTDLVSVKPPGVSDFGISFTYYINRSDKAKAVTIQEQVAAAVEDYVTWQTTEIGRDINPDALIQRIKAAGAKRVVLTSPVFTVVAETEVAQCSTVAATYGGLEDD